MITILIACLYVLCASAVAIYDRRIGVEIDESDWLTTIAMSVAWPLTLLLFGLWLLVDRRKS